MDKSRDTLPRASPHASNNFDQLIYAALVLNSLVLCDERMSFDSSFNTLFRVYTYMNVRLFVYLFDYVFFCINVWEKSMNANVLLYSVVISLCLLLFSNKHYIHVSSSISLFIHAASTLSKQYTDILLFIYGIQLQ